MRRLVQRVWRPRRRRGGAERYPVCDLRNEGTDPMEAYYERGGQPCLVRVPLADCRWLGASGLSYAPDSLHPYVRTLLDYAAGRCTRYAGSYLERYWAAWRPASLAAYLGVDETEGHPLLRQTPAVHDVLPWSPADRVAYMEAGRWTERADHRALWDAGCPPARSCGPKPGWFGEIRFAHLAGIYERIRRDGYRETAIETVPYAHQHPVGMCLVRGAAVRVVVVNGQHRAAALAALGHAHAPVIVHGPTPHGPSIARREDVECWPLVRRGVVSVAGALAVFDRVFDAIPPAAVSALRSPAIG